MLQEEDYPIILFDGVCNFCNNSVNFIIKHKKKDKQIRFASLQSKVGTSLKEMYKIPENVDSIILINNKRLYFFSSALIEISKYLSFPYNFLTGFLIIPRFVRDWVYQQFAKRRYKWFGKKDTCIIPSKEVKNWFLE